MILSLIARSRLGIAGLGVIAAMAAYGSGYALGDRAGYKRATADAIVIAARDYQETIRRIEDAGLDVGNPDAVACVLQRLAGLSTEGCGDL